MRRSVASLANSHALWAWSTPADTATLAVTCRVGSYDSTRDVPVRQGSWNRQRLRAVARPGRQPARGSRSRAGPSLVRPPGRHRRRRRAARAARRRGRWSGVVHGLSQRRRQHLADVWQRDPAVRPLPCRGRARVARRAAGDRHPRRRQGGGLLCGRRDQRRHGSTARGAASPGRSGGPRARGDRSRHGQPPCGRVRESRSRRSARCTSRPATWPRTSPTGSTSSSWSGRASAGWRCGSTSAGWGRPSPAAPVPAPRSSPRLSLPSGPPVRRTPSTCWAAG